MSRSYLNDDLPSETRIESYLGIGHLIELGKRKSFITLDDILTFLPEADQDVNQLEEVFAALDSAGIHFLDVDSQEILDKDVLSGESEGDVDNLVEPVKLDEGDLGDVDVSNVIGLYLKEVGHIPLLTQEEEMDLAQQIERGNLAREELALGGASNSRRRELCSLIEAGQSARDHLITANARLVISVAKKYTNRGLSLLDLIQEGNIGLLRATHKYDYRLGYKFSTYAYWWIRQAITRAITDQARAIRIPVHIHDYLIKILRARHRLTQNLGRDPTVEELAGELEVSVQRIESILRATKLPLSLDMPANIEEDLMLGDFIADEGTPTPDELATNNILREHFEEVFKSLPLREVVVLKLRYGLVDGRTYTLDEVGQKLGVTRERVRQIEAKAFGRLRGTNISHELLAYLSE